MAASYGGFEEVAIKCSYCSGKQQIMKLCTQCRTTVYCSRECQVRDWPEHKKCCNNNKNQMQSSFEKTAVLDNYSQECVGSEEKTSVPVNACKSTESSQHCKQEIKCVSVNKESFSKTKELSDAMKSEYDCLDTKNTNEYIIRLSTENTPLKSDNDVTIYIRHHKEKKQLNVKKSEDGTSIFREISEYLRIPISKMKLINKGRMITPENLTSILHNKALFLAFGEVSECEDGLDKGDIDTLMQQLNVERNVAVNALKRTGTLLDAIFDIGDSM